MNHNDDIQRITAAKLVAVERRLAHLERRNARPLLTDADLIIRVNFCAADFCVEVRT